MIRAYTLSELAEALAGSLYGNDRTISGISIDSRTVQPGELFIAITGPSFDGHAYVKQAMQSGAAAVLVHDAGVAVGVPHILVDDTFQALTRLGAYNRAQTDIPFLAITGSCGKTSVKEMLASVLQQAGTTMATRGNLNNAYGVPLTLFEVAATDQFAAIELGTSSPGEIKPISELTRPAVAVITNASETHLDQLIDVAGVAHEKGFILDTLPKNGTAVLNLDDPFFSQWQNRVLSGHDKRQVLSFSLSDSRADCFASDIQSTPEGMCFTLHLGSEQSLLTIAFWGQHQVQNACCAALAASAVGLTLDSIVQGLESARPYQRRGQRFVLNDKTLVIDETYNANPKATLAAIDQLADCAGHTVLVLGDMLDLGSVSQQRHYEVGAYARDKGINALAAYGEASRRAVSGFRHDECLEEGSKGRHFEKKEALLDWIQTLLKPFGDEQKTVLVKGSRGMNMLDIVRSLVGSDYKGER